jgi:ATP-dependent Lon protease
MLKHSDLFTNLPQKFYDSAFLDRIHFYIPGWEMDIIRGEMFSSGYGFVVDYLAEILRFLRSHDYSDRYQKYFSLTSDISARDRDSIHKTFSGLMKLLFPCGEATSEEMEKILQFAIEGRKRVKDQLIRMDSTYPAVHFAYLNQSGNSQDVVTLEEQEYPQYYNKIIPTENLDSTITLPPDFNSHNNLKEQTITINENQKGITFDRLFGPYIQKVNQLTIIEPNLKNSHQIDNFIEFLETVIKFKSEEENILIHLITTDDEFQVKPQHEALNNIAKSCSTVGIDLTWEVDSAKIQDDSCQIITAHGWQIILSRGLNLFQQHDKNNIFSFSNRLQQLRLCKACQITCKRKFVDH